MRKAVKLFQNKKLRKQCHIYEMLKSSAKGRHISFHTPGHKVGRWDITELSYSDNLSAPRGCIARAEEDIARLLGASRSFILTDGSTSGVLSMLYAAKKMGVKALFFPEGSHKSVYNGCRLMGITPLVLRQKTEGGVPLPLRVEELTAQEPLLAACDGILITSPDYYGGIADLQGLRAYCDKHEKLLLIDGAHGGHLRFERELYAGSYADFWVDGVHKSLPCYTQGAVASARTEAGSEALYEGVQIFRTTSPSYPIMASVEYAVKFPRNEGLEKAVRAFASVEKRVCLQGDWTKLCVRFGKNAFEVEKALQKQGLYPEFCDGSIVQFYLSPATKKREWKKLKRVLIRLLQAYPYEEEKVIQRNPAPLVFPANGETEWVKAEKCAGRICAAACGLFPPCTPLIARGERVEEEKLRLLNAAASVYGLTDGKMMVFKEEE